jgi:hypothetical protein
MNFRRDFLGGSWRDVVFLTITVISLLMFAYIRSTMDWSSTAYKLYHVLCWTATFGGLTGFTFCRNRS